MFHNKLLTSKKQNWRTPKFIYEELNKEFNFDFDPCLLETDTIHKQDMLGSLKEDYVLMMKENQLPFLL